MTFILTILVALFIGWLVNKIPDSGIRRADDGRYYRLEDLDAYPPCSYLPKPGAKPIK